MTNLFIGITIAVTMFSAGFLCGCGWAVSHAAAFTGYDAENGEWPHG